MSELDLREEATENPQQPGQEADETSKEDAIEDPEPQRQVIDEQAQGDETQQHQLEDEEVSWEDTIEDFEGQRQGADERSTGGPAGPSSRSDLQSAADVSVTDKRPPNLKFILDIPLQITVELGRRRLLVNELLQLNQGSVIELDKQIGEPFDILVNHKLIARGEVVVINEKFGIRITDIISPMERVQQL